MTAIEGLDLSTLISERIDKDSQTLEEVKEQIADLILVREILESLQSARVSHVGGNTTKITPIAWAEFVQLPLSSENSPDRSFEESKQRLASALGRIGTAFDIPEATMRVTHSHVDDGLVVSTKLFEDNFLQ